MNMKDAQQEYEGKLANHFVNCYFPKYLGCRERIKSHPPRQSGNTKIPEFKYSDAQTGNTLVLELTTLVENDELMQKIRDAWSLADKLRRQTQLDGTFHCWLRIEEVRDELLDDMIASIQSLSANLGKGISSSQQHPFPYCLTKEDDTGSELHVFLLRSSIPKPDETKLKEQLLTKGAYEANLKFEGYEESRRILLVDISFCIGGNFSEFSLRYSPDQQLNSKIERTYPRVDAIVLCTTIRAWRGDGKPIPLHGHQAGIERLRLVPEQRIKLPRYRETGHWMYSWIYDRKWIQNP